MTLSFSLVSFSLLSAPFWRSLSRSIESLHEHERLLWVGAVTWYGFGDTVTTYWGLSTGGVAEAGPIAGPAMEAVGPVALLVVKICLFALWYAVWTRLRTSGRVAVPLSRTVVGALVTGWNLSVILVAAIA